jgi:hypothetical protein
MKFISFNCKSCKKDNTVPLLDILSLTPMGSHGVSADSDFMRGFGGMMAGDILSGGLGALASGRMPNSVALDCEHCNTKNIISLP